MKTWIKALNIEEIPKMGSRALKFKEKEMAIFKTKNRDIQSISNLCPHKKLSEGLVHEDMFTCPLHNWI